MADLDYKVVLDRLREKTREKFQLEKRLQDMQNDFGKLDNEKDHLSNRLQSQLETERTRQYSEHLSRCTAPFNSELMNSRKTLFDLQNEKQRALSSVSKDAIFNKLKESAGLDSEAEKGLSEVRQMVAEEVGERFEKEFFDYVKPKRIPFEQVNLKQFVLDFRDTSAKVKRFKTPSLGFVTNISSVIDKHSRSKLEGKPKGALILIAILSVLVLVLAKLIFPFYILFLTAIIGINLYKGSFYSKILRKYKELSANLSAFEKSLMKAADKQYKKQIEDITEDFSNRVSDAENKLKNVERSLEEAKENAKNSFVFDDKNVMASHQMSLSSADQQHLDMEKQIEAVKDKILETSLTIEELRKEKSNQANLVKMEYLNPENVSGEYILKRDFLVDIVDDKPVFFDMPNGSVLYLYDSRQTADEFVMLLIFQLRNRLNSNCLRVEVWDKTLMGRSFYSCRNELKDLIKIVYEQDDIKDTVEDARDLLIKRAELIVREFSDIDKYNSAMLELDSLTEYYKFYFIFSDDSTLLNDETIKKMLVNGSVLGMNVHIFMPKDKLEKKHSEVVQNTKKFFKIQNGEINSQSSDSMLNLIHNFK